MSQKCPNCKITSIDDKATVCKYCGSNYSTDTKSEKFEQSSLTTNPPSLRVAKQSKKNDKTPQTPNFVMTSETENLDSKAALGRNLSDTEDNEQTQTSNQIVSPMTENSTQTYQNQKSQPAGNWRLLALTTGFALLAALAIIGFQSFQIQANSNKLKNFEDKAMTQQKSLADLDTLTSQNAQLTQNMGEIKSELEAKTKILDELQSKATSLSDESKSKDEKLSELQAENKALTTKNNTLTAQSNSATKELESLKNTPLGKLISLNK